MQSLNETDPDKYKELSRRISGEMPENFTEKYE